MEIICLSMVISKGLFYKVGQCQVLLDGHQDGHTEKYKSEKVASTTMPSGILQIKSLNSIQTRIQCWIRRLAFMLKHIHYLLNGQQDSVTWPLPREEYYGMVFKSILWYLQMKESSTLKKLTWLEKKELTFWLSKA